MKSLDVVPARALGAIVFLSWAGLASAQLSGPVAGYVFHSPTKSIRPILGVPGSALLSQPIVRDVDFASASPDGKWALIRRADSWLVLRLGTSGREESEVADLVSGVTMAAWSSSGRAVVVGSPSGKALQTIRRNGDMWLADPPLDLSALPGTLVTLATDYSGDHSVFGLADPGDGGFYLASDAAPILLKSTPRPAFAVFGPNGDTLYLAAAATGLVEVFQGTNQIGSWPLAAPDTPAVEIVAIAPSFDRKRILVLLKDVSTLRSFDLASGLLLPDRPLDCAPSTLIPLANENWFLVSSPLKADEPLIIFRDSDPAVTYFVPIADDDPSSL